MKSCDIKLYALSTCIHCRNTKEFLDKGASTMTAWTSIHSKARKGGNNRRDQEREPSCSFPMLIIGNRVIIGFKSEEIREALSLE